MSAMARNGLVVAFFAVLTVLVYRKAQTNGHTSSDAGTLGIVDVLSDYVLNDSVVFDGPEPGEIHFNLPPAYKLSGIVCAWYAPLDEQHGRPRLDHAKELALLQLDDGHLSLSSWLSANEKLPNGVLFYSLRVGAEQDATFVVGTAVIDRWRLDARGTTIHPTMHAAHSVHVNTSNGSPLPGAHVAFQRRGLPVGPGAVSTMTGPRGVVRVFGLHPKVSWDVAVLGSGGPIQSAESRVDDTRNVTTITLPLRGAWSFTPISIRRVGRGQSISIIQIEQQGGKKLHAWPVSTLVFPGLQEFSTSYVATPTSTPPQDADTWTLHTHGLQPTDVVRDDGGRYVVRYDFGSFVSANTESAIDAPRTTRVSGN